MATSMPEMCLDQQLFIMQFGEITFPSFGVCLQQEPTQMFGYSVPPGKVDGHSVLVGSGKVRSGRITCLSQIMIQEYWSSAAAVIDFVYFCV
jgi:hypothetical protein